MKLFNRLLLPLSTQGFLWLILLFSLCFLGVHILKLTLLGADTLHTATPPPKEEEKQEKKAPATSQEPIYYIVERKTRRAKSSYKEPKEIRFK